MAYHVSTLALPASRTDTRTQKAPTCSCRLVPAVICMTHDCSQRLDTKEVISSSRTYPYEAPQVALDNPSFQGSQTHFPLFCPVIKADQAIS
jgi:hypothetical protein